METGGLHEKAFETGKIDLGDQANLLTGAFLATSPETSLRAVLQENFIQAIRVHDLTLRGSDTVQSILTFGASSILGRGALIDLQVGIGLTTFAQIFGAPLRRLPLWHGALSLINWPKRVG